MQRIDKDEFNAIVYTKVDNYGYKLQVVQDLDAGKRVIVLSDKTDILQYYGQILSNYGQYNVYKIEDWDDVDDDFIDEVANRDQSKDEAIIYVGKPLSETVIEVINELKLNDNQKRILSVVKDLIKGSDSDVKQQAALNLLNERYLKLKAEKTQIESELNELRTTISQEQNSSQYIKSTIKLDAFLSDTQVMYFREYYDVLYFNTLIRHYQEYLETKLNLKAKIVIFDYSLFEMYEEEKYPKKISSLDDYMGNRSLFLGSDTIVSNQVYPLLVSDLYKAGFDVLIILDRILNIQPIVDGKNVHTFYNVGHNNQLNYYKSKLEKDPNLGIVISSRLNYDNAINIPQIQKEFTSKQEEFYWYNKLGNVGQDKRLIFQILDDKRQPLNYH